LHLAKYPHSSSTCIYQVLLSSQPSAQCTQSVWGRTCDNRQPSDVSVLHRKPRP